MLLITACEDQQQAPSDLEDTNRLLDNGDNTRTNEYICGDGFRIQTSHEPRHDQLVLFMTDRAVELQQVRSASGAKFEAQDIVFWSKDKRALLQRNGKPDIECQQVKPIAD